MKRIALELLLILAAAYSGLRYEATRIQLTCEADNEATVLNGTAYICLTADAARAIRQQLQQHGA